MKWVILDLTEWWLELWFGLSEIYEIMYADCNYIVEFSYPKGRWNQDILKKYCSLQYKNLRL